VVVVRPRGFGLSVVGLLRTDCLGPGICAGSEDDESDCSLRHYHRDHHHHLEVPGGFHHYQEEYFLLAINVRRTVVFWRIGILQLRSDSGCSGDPNVLSDGWMGLHGGLMVALIDGGAVVPVTRKILLGCGEILNVVDSQVGCNVVLCVVRSSSMPARLEFCVVLV